MSTALSLPSPAAVISPGGLADALALYQCLLPAEFFTQLLPQQGVHENNRVYTTAVVMGLMIWQRMKGNAPLEGAVLELLRGLPSTFWPRPCKRLQRWRQDPAALSSQTGAYNQARQGLSVRVVEHSCDPIFAQLTAATLGAVADRGSAPAFFVDGTTVRLPHRESLRQLYPPGSNQHGESHWPLLRMVVAHDMQTGLAMRPQWGPMHGPNAVSEQQLLRLALDRLPARAIVAGDCNFGIFMVAYESTQRHHPVVLRLTLARAKALLRRPLQDGTDPPVRWQPSREEREKYPDWPPPAGVEGRLLVRQVQPNNGKAPFPLVIFTTLSESPDVIVRIYGQRWNIETDLRRLKSTLHLDELASTTPKMVTQELDLAMAAYHLVRAVICLAAQNAATAPRSYSFTRVRNIVDAFEPLITAARDPEEARMYYRRMMHCVNQAKLPRRVRKRPSYPRAVWSRGEKYPSRKT